VGETSRSRSSRAEARSHKVFFLILTPEALCLTPDKTGRSKSKTPRGKRPYETSLHHHISWTARTNKFVRGTRTCQPIKSGYRTLTAAKRGQGVEPLTISPVRYPPCPRPLWACGQGVVPQSLMGAKECKKGLASKKRQSLQSSPSIY